MNMLQNPSRASSVLRDWTQTDAGLDDCYLSDARESVSAVALATRSVFAGRLKELAGRSILIATDHQLAAGLAFLELDGLARRIIVCPPDIASGYLPGIMANAEVDAIVSDRVRPEHQAAGVTSLLSIRKTCSKAKTPRCGPIRPNGCC